MISRQLPAVSSKLYQFGPVGEDDGRELGPCAVCCTEGDREEPLKRIPWPYWGKRLEAGVPSAGDFVSGQEFLQSQEKEIRTMPKLKRSHSLVASYGSFYTNLRS